MTTRLASYCLIAALLAFEVLMSGDVFTTNAPDGACFFAMIGFLLASVILFVYPFITAK